jgi:hypothetical protein
MMVENFRKDLEVAVGEVVGNFETNFCWKRWHRHRENCTMPVLVSWQEVTDKQRNRRGIDICSLRRC